jgi:glycosyltransferase involved in cell wall biosynthesis
VRGKIYVNGRFLTQKTTGVQRVATEISTHLQMHYKEEIIFVCPNQELINPVAASLNCIKVGFFGGYLWEQIDLPFYLFRKKVALLLNFCNTAPMMYSKNLLVIHDVAFKVNKKWFDWKFIFVYNILFYFNLKRAKSIITVSNFSKNEILKFYPKTKSKKIQVVYLASFLENKESKLLKKEYYLAINSLNERKNIKVIIEAFKLLDPNIYKLKVIGEKNIKVFKENNYEAISNVEFLEEVTDISLYKWIIEAKALINASFYEGFGLPALEAMSLHTPCILSDISVYRELYSETAIFFDATSANQLAEQVEAMEQSDNYFEVCEKGFELSQNFSWTGTSKQYISIIESLKTKNVYFEESIN